MPNLLRLVLIVTLGLSSTICSGQTSISGTINDYASVTSFLQCEAGITVNSTTGFVVGEHALIFQMKGATVDLSNNNNFGTVTNYDEAGNWERITISSISVDTLFFTDTLLRDYQLSGIVQIVNVPRYGKTDVVAGLNGSSWNGSIGGIIAFETTDTLTLLADIDNSGRGFRGGQTYSTSFTCNWTDPDFDDYYYTIVQDRAARKGEGIVLFDTNYECGRGPWANGGGGASDHNAGGGGGASYGFGGTGGDRIATSFFQCSGDVPGLGGFLMSYGNSENKVYLGGGGGAGHDNNGEGTSGGNGGGIVYIKAPVIVGNNYSILSRGNGSIMSQGDGAGGGGGGGVILLDVPIYADTVLIDVRGGNGGNTNNAGSGTQCNGPGGGGGGGTIWYSVGSTPANVLTGTGGGSPGETVNGNAHWDCDNNSTNGAASGASGSELYNLVVPVGVGTHGPFADAGPGFQICPGDTVTFQPSGGISYLWSPSIFLDDSTSANPMVLADSSLVYTVTVTNSNGCRDTDSLSVLSSPEILSYAIPANIPCIGINIGGGKVYAQGGISPYSYFWSNGTNTSTAANYLAGHHGVTVTDSNGCESTSDVDVFLPFAGEVLVTEKVSDLAGNFFGVIDDQDRFGNSGSYIRDLDGDGYRDLAVGAFGDDDGGGNYGAIYILNLNSFGAVINSSKISSTSGNFTGFLSPGDFFGTSIANIGDLDGDGIEDLAVGAYGDNDGGNDAGAVWILFMDWNGTVKSHQKISGTSGNFTNTSTRFGCSVTGMKDFDLDGVPDIVVGAREDDDGGTNRGAVYLLTLRTDGTVKGQVKISDTQGGFNGILDDHDEFGQSVSFFSDFDDDGVYDLLVGAANDDDGGTDRGAAWILLLNPNGTVKQEFKISSTTTGFAGYLDDDDGFGTSILNFGDLDADGALDILAGAPGDDDGGAEKGAIYAIYLTPSVGVKRVEKISELDGGFSGSLDNDDAFGFALFDMLDIDQTGSRDLGVGAFSDDDGGPNRGAFYKLNMRVAKINLNITTTGATCVNSANGTATVNPTGGFSPYTYLWFNGDTSQTTVNLLPGLHPVTVTDANGCEERENAFVGLSVPPTHPDTCTWLGGVDSLWFNPCNWDKIAIPTNTCNVIIPGGTTYQPWIIGDTAVCKSIQIFDSNGGHLFNNVGSGGRLEIGP